MLYASEMFILSAQNSVKSAAFGSGNQFACNSAMAVTGTSLELSLAGISTLGQHGQNLQAFSGLQEGLLILE